MAWKAQRQYNEQTVVVLERAMSAGGLTVDKACASAGISRETYYRWLRTKPEFSARIEKARAGGQLGMLAIIRAAAQKTMPCPHCHKDVPSVGDWRAAAEWLKLTEPQTYNRRYEDVTVEETVDVRVESLVQLVREYVPADRLNGVIRGRITAARTVIDVEPPVKLPGRVSGVRSKGVDTSGPQPRDGDDPGVAVPELQHGPRITKRQPTDATGAG
jgi:hypothetical protein